MIRNIVFDLGQVLVTFSPEYIVRRCAPDLPEEDVRLLVERVVRDPEWIKLDSGEASEEELIPVFCRRLPERLHNGIAALLRGWINCLLPIGEMQALAQSLGGAGYRRYLLSNVSHRFWAIKEQIPPLDGYLVSADERLIKPDPAIYQRLFERFSLDPGECFFIDDREENIDAARACGMDGFVFTGDMAALKEALRQAGVVL